MDTSELQAKATIAAALIASRAVEIPAQSRTGHWLDDPAAVRLREVTERIYQAIALPAPDRD